jgi:hypothetical protein
MNRMKLSCKFFNPQNPDADDDQGTKPHFIFEKGNTFIELKILSGCR